MSSSPSHKTENIPPIFFNRTLRFLLLRIICACGVLLICEVPYVFVGCDVEFPNDSDAISAIVAFERNSRIYLYTAPSSTFLHHLASAFGPKFSLPGIIDFALVIGEAAAFLLQAITGQFGLPIIDLHFRQGSCNMKIMPMIIPKVLAWLISISLVAMAMMRVAEALESNGRYFWTRYDITRSKLAPRHAQYDQSTTPNGFKVITGVQLWTEHFMREGKWLVLSRGIVALLLMIVAITFSFSTIVLDPSSEGEQLPVKVTRSSTNFPYMGWPTNDLYIFVALPPLDIFDKKPEISNFSDAITTSRHGHVCSPYVPRMYPEHPTFFLLRFLTVKCAFTTLSLAEPDSVLVGVNYTTLRRVVGEGDTGWTSVQIMISSDPDPSVVFRRTELPVVLLPGMNLLGFVRQHIVQQFRYPRLATLGISVPFDELAIFEITHVQSIPQGTPTPTSNETASLVLFPRSDFSDMKIIQDSREKSVLRGLSSVGGLWAFLCFIFGALFGSSLVRVVFGVKPLSISGIAHSFSGRTRQSYKEEYPNINPKTIDEGKDLNALIINHLLDVDLLFSEDTSRDAPQTAPDQAGNDIESSGEKGEVDPVKSVSLESYPTAAP